MLLCVFAIPFMALNFAAGLIWVERRLLAVWQERYGPNRVGPFGLLQPLADAIKLHFKEDWIPPFADKAVFVVAPAIVMATAMLSCAILPIAPGIGVMDNWNVGLLFFLAMSSMGAYSVVLAGWASNNKYSLLGGLRSAAQMLSYEVFMGLSLMGVVVMTGTFELREIVEQQKDMWFCIPQFLGMVIFLLAGLAETNRAPFDMPEAEAELVAGYNVEYSAMTFALFFLGEYANMFLMAGMTVVLFLGGWLPPFDIAPLNWIPGPIWFITKICAVLFVFLWVRATFPRYRYDQLMRLGWKVFLPLSLLAVVGYSGALVAFGWLPS
ncbi:MAG: NADH-quinone oxidoreductase subunit NuoH [Proteobacteria bacterium]|nr:NADH-quinone oxidoreductase subunit NuoH [Pseudomonadota bacterium]